MVTCNIKMLLQNIIFEISRSCAPAAGSNKKKKRTQDLIELVRSGGEGGPARMDLYYWCFQQVERNNPLPLYSALVSPHLESRA